MIRSSFFYFEAGVLAEAVTPRSGTPYVHRCTLETFREVCHRADELGTFTLEELVAAGEHLPNSAAALALRFLHEYGLLERVYPKRNRSFLDGLELEAMTCWHGLREAGEVRR